MTPPPADSMRGGGGDEDLPDSLAPGTSIPTTTTPVLRRGDVRWASWVALLALASFAAGIVCLNARRNREFAAAGFIAGVVSLLVSLTIGLPTGFQILV